MIKLIIEDEALNSSTPSGAPLDETLGLIDPLLVADTTAVVGKDVNVKFTDKSGTLLASKDLEVKIQGGTATTADVLTLMTKGTDNKWTGDYKIASGRITISKDAISKRISDFTKDTTFTITVNAAGIKQNSTVDQTVKAVSAPVNCYCSKSYN